MADIQDLPFGTSLTDRPLSELLQWHIRQCLEHLKRGRDVVYFPSTAHLLFLTPNLMQVLVTLSFDAYYRRTLKRDFEYGMAFKEKTDIEGKRLPSTAYSRTYIE